MMKQSHSMLSFCEIIEVAVTAVYSSLFEIWGGYVPNSLIKWGEIFARLASYPEGQTLRLTPVATRWDQIATRLKPIAAAKKLSWRQREAIRKWYGRILIRDMRLVVEGVAAELGHRVDSSSFKPDRARKMLDMFDEKLRGETFALQNIDGRQVPTTIRRKRR